MEPEIVEVDRCYRRNLFLAYLAVILFVLVLWRWGKPLLVSHIVSLPNKERIEFIERAEQLLLLLFIPAAIYLIAVGRKVCRFQAMPYPGMRVIRDTVIVRGKKALFRGRAMIILGTVMIVLVAASMIATHLILLKFKRHPLFRPVFYGSEV